MKQLKNLTILLCFLSLIAFISCSAKDKTGGDGNDDGVDSVPTFTGNPATDLPNGYYKGTLSCKSHNIYNFVITTGTSLGMTKEEFEREITNDTEFYLKINNNILRWEQSEDIIEYEYTWKNKEALKSDSEYGATILDIKIGEQISGKTKETIRFTISGDTISITHILGESVATMIGKNIDYKYSIVATYEGTLTKYTPTTTPSGS